MKNPGKKSLMSTDKPISTYDGLKSEIGKLLLAGRAQAGRAVNTILVQVYWQIGRHIVEFEQRGKHRADYGLELLDTLSKDLTSEYGKGFSRSNLFQIRQFYIKYPNIQTLSGQLSWSHLKEMLYLDDPLKRNFCIDRLASDD